MEISIAETAVYEPIYGGPVKIADKDAGHAYATESAGDVVNVSRDALLLTEAICAAQTAPDVRKAKTDALRARIAAGSYSIDAQSIAAGLVRENPGLFR